MKVLPDEDHWHCVQFTIAVEVGSKSVADGAPAGSGADYGAERLSHAPEGREQLKDAVEIDL